MSTVNHLPRACIGPGNRPGIGAPGGKHLNSISDPLLGFGLYYALVVRATRVCGGLSSPAHVLGARETCWPCRGSRTRKGVERATTLPLLRPWAQPRSGRNPCLWPRDRGRPVRSPPSPRRRRSENQP